ncbi:MAG: SdiA-regulated domain-containing protein, partial [Sedimentisphaerales bacterium]|nr:SdiA-regulated domain-containing protein [Sedimentisphaerales bacterium]
MKANIKSAILIGLFLINQWAISASNFPASALPGVSLTNGTIDKKEFSGIAWHNSQQIFYLVSDNDYLTKMSAAGQILSHIPVDGNMEAVTMIPGRNDFIYIGIEDPDSIYEYNINTNQITRVFDLTNWMDGPDNGGLEGLTFVPDSSNSEGGLFYAGMQ